MRQLVRRHLGKLLAGTAIAVTGTALMVGITLPGTAGADDTNGTGGQARGPVAAGRAGAEEGGEAGSGSAAGSRPPAVAVPREGERGVGSDPLTPAELSRAEQIALTPAARSDGENAAGGRGPQHLATNLAEPPPSAPDAAVRRAEVSFYDYRADELVTSTVNLDTGKVERTGVQRGVQPSPHPDELREAVALILADPLGSDLKADYRHATGRSLTSPDQLWFNGDVYRTYREKDVPDELARCGEHRCVRLVTKVVNGPWIEIRNLIVDLSARTVARVG
ncbi:Tat pathway signal sequence domain protein [Streptomyces sp. PKU-EA00015]|uniref:Tat pathway signal sequence domain protein n=1 Tax=Streptomyces sp. PKU-EA00015 TaxID=2748326 RepID=UPI0015A2ED24|nr:Tat pathway signal sequence domain protein [Streptomyces sp. PKU-EA00015]NWF29287.1 Tat pathway signal sequence domain protein [Streptomyces sp. PKU-EA00015]